MSDQSNALREKMADDLVNRLQDNVADILDWNGKVMTAWDTVRAMIANGNKGSLPRDIMESYLSGYMEDMKEAADRIEKLEAALREIDEWAEEQCYVGLRTLINSALEWKKDD